MGAFVISPLPPCLEDVRCSKAPLLHGCYPLPRYYEPGRRRLVFSRFPGGTGYTAALLHRFLGGTRTVSPVAQHHPVTALPLTTPPGSQTASGSARSAMLPSPPPRGLGLRSFFSCRGHHWVHVRCGPVTRSPSQGWLRRSASSVSFPSRMRPKLQRFLTFPPAGLSPAEHV